MKLILEITTFQLINKLSSKLESIFEFVKIKGNIIYCSNLLDRGGNPVVRIDSKKPCKGLMIKLNHNTLEIKSIVNSTSEKGFGKSVMDVITKTIPKDFKVIIDQDVSGGFWDNIIKKYPNITFEKK
jgi:hypothetical protein